MKRILSLLCAAVMLVSVVALTGCDKKEEETTESVKEISPIELFKTVWNSYGEEDLFPIAGGDFDHSNMEAPDAFDIVTNKADLYYSFLINDEIYEEIQGDAATVRHMMNTNTFCAAMFKVGDTSKINGLAEAYKSSVQSNMWMCGMPDTVVVLSVGDVMIVAYGADEIVDTFKAKCIEADKDIKVLVEAPAVEG